MAHNPTATSTTSATDADSNSASSKEICAICLGNVKSGCGQALFTAECSHSFHFTCISNSVKHGNRICPICRFQWKQIPSLLPHLTIDINNVGPTTVPHNLFGPHPAPWTLGEPRFFPDAEPRIFSDDEPLPPEVTPADARVGSQDVTIKTFTELPAIASSDSVSRFAVLVGLQAPPLVGVARTAIDLVTVLDVSGSMDGSKLRLLKQAVHFIIDNLGASDRLSIVSFSSNSRRILPLCRMTDVGRENAKRAVNSLAANGGTNIVEGLKKGARVLEERREMNPVASIILLSDGQDNYNSNYGHRFGGSHQQATPYLNLLPASINSRNREAPDERERSTFPVHAFGFGLDHDSSAMHAISDVSGGTYSFIESVNMVQDAFASCIGGLLSVVAQEVHLTVKSASPGVKIGSIPSGRYPSEISEQGSLGVINVGDLYAEEAREFIIHLSVPPYSGEENDAEVGKTSLLDITCSYKDSVSKESVSVEGQRVEIRRPRILSPTDSVASVEVDRQMNRLLVAESLAESRQLAEMGNLDGALAVLTSRNSALRSSVSAQAGDPLCKLLEDELSETIQRMRTRESYENTGRAFMLSGISSHAGQRATSRGDNMMFGAAAAAAAPPPPGAALAFGSRVTVGGAMYQTSAMASMLKKSQASNPTLPPK